MKARITEIPGMHPAIALGARAALAIALVGAAGAPALAAAPKKAASPAWGSPVRVEGGRTRLVIPVPNARLLKTTPHAGSVSVELTGSTSGPVAYESAVGSGVLSHVRMHAFEGKIYLQASWRYPTAVQAVPVPGGLELRFPHRDPGVHFATVAPGVQLWQAQRWLTAGPVRIRALRVDPKQAEVRPVVPSAQATRPALATVSAMAKGYGAIAAINGGFFSPGTGAPQGTLVLDGRLISRAMLDRPAIWWKPDGSAFFSAAKPAIKVRLEDGALLSPHGVNEGSTHDRLMVFTPEHGQRTGTVADPSRWEIAVGSDGRVAAEGLGNLAVPRGGYVLSAQGKALDALKSAVGLGQDLRLEADLPEGAVAALGAGPTLMSNGKVAVLAKAQRFRADVANGRAPRSALGLTADGKLLLATIDGRDPKDSVGMTLVELAKLMKEMGAVQAMNLDGGGSSALWLKGRTINSPSDGRERPVSTALLVLPRRSGDLSAQAPVGPWLSFE